MTSDDSKTVEEKVDELQSPDTFDFLAVLSGQTQPKDSVGICLDKATVYEIAKLEVSKKSLTDEADMDAADAKLAKLKKSLAANTYTFKLTGISGEFREALAESAKEKFKPEFETSKNFISGQVEKFEKPNPERNKFLGLSVFQASVEQIVSPDGKVITAPEVGVIDAFLTKAPDAEVSKFIKAVEALEVTVHQFEEATNEDFLVKS